MKIILLILVGISVSLAFTLGSSEELKWEAMISGDAQVNDALVLEMYKDWMEHYSKDLSNPTQSMQRFTNFKSKAYEVISHNKDITKTWTKGINAWSDLTDAEFNALYPVMEEPECSATNAQSFNLL